MPTPRELIASLQSDLCPACAGSKEPGRTLCLKCFRRLPRVVQGQLYLRVGNGYEQAVERAMTALEAPKFHLVPQRTDQVEGPVEIPEDQIPY